jgi:hypothetical protein
MRAEDLRLITLKNRMSDKERIFVSALLKSLTLETEFKVNKFLVLSQPVLNYLNEMGYTVNVDRDIPFDGNVYTTTTITW